MHFLTWGECREWCEAWEVPLDANGMPMHPTAAAHHAKVAIPRDFTRSLPFCQALERSLLPRHACLMWVTESEIWYSNVNRHLYYRLRQSYGDHRLIDHAPGHVFLDCEAPDLVSEFGGHEDVVQEFLALTQI